MDHTVHESFRSDKEQRMSPATGYSLIDLVHQSEKLAQVYKANLHAGDFVMVKTCNSIYTIRVVSEKSYIVSGGWFDRKGLSPVKMTINGCTWGGSVIKMDIVAACGLCMEFGNRLITSTIQKIVVIPNASQN